ncbi:MAG: nodulation protein NfeD [Proteobacteria bacterium]|nr:nodulation protein NfeD [Pseudomonadota bacterium]
MCVASRGGNLALAATLLALVVAASLLVRSADAAGAAVQPPPQARPASAGTAVVLEIDGAIGPATSRYIVQGIAHAQRQGAALVILQIDTPGGLDSAMRDIIRAILASEVPVVGFVSPPGARAASAGTYILYASHVAAMAPATNLGAATPVPVGGAPEAAPVPGPAQPKIPGGGGKPDDGKRGDGNGITPPPSAAADGSEPADAMERKVVNDAVAYIRSLADLRGRNGDWAEKAVRGAASLPAQAALQQRVIDVIARDVPELLRRIDGREVHLAQRTVKLATRDLTPVTLHPDWRTQLLAVITHPTVAYGLMLIGIWGLLLEGYNPGAVLPGVVGSICLLVALFAFQILSVNYAGLALVAVGVGLIVAEFFFPTYGSLGIGGLIAFVVGSLILFDSDVPGMSVGRPLIAGLAAVGAVVIGGIVWLAARAQRRPVATGAAAMVGASAEVVGEFAGRGQVRYGGELWQARSQAPLRAGETVRIVRVENLTLWVEPG